MKILLKVVGVIVACVILALVILRFTGLDPAQRRAGLWLRGNVAAFPADWTFAQKTPTLMVETHPWYLIAHSVTIFFVTDAGNLYLHADYTPGKTFPYGKSWTAGLAHDPTVRIKIGGRVYAGKVTLVTDPAEFNKLFEDFRKKYPRSRYSDYSRRKDVFFLHVLPR